MLILQSLKYQGCGNQQQQPKNAMDATTVNMEPGTTTLMQSPVAAVTQVNGSGGGNGSDPGGDKVKRLSAIADRVGCNLVQLQLAWQLRNQVRPLMHFFLSKPFQVTLSGKFRSNHL